MNTNTYILWCSCVIAILIGVTQILLVIHIENSVISSPVEEMYHKQLVTTVDSILDARFGADCCAEDSIEQELCFD